MANATQFIGSKISLISKSEIRYEGILYSLDVVEATISLAKVKSYGTEDRPTERPVPPKDEIYEFIIFRGADIKGIDVVEPPKGAASVNDGIPNDPAIVEVSHYHTSGRGSSSAGPSGVHGSFNQHGVPVYGAVGGSGSKPVSQTNSELLNSSHEDTGDISAPLEASEGLQDPSRSNASTPYGSRKSPLVDAGTQSHQNERQGQGRGNRRYNNENREGGARGGEGGRNGGGRGGRGYGQGRGGGNQQGQGVERQGGYQPRGRGNYNNSRGGNDYQQNQYRGGGGNFRGGRGGGFRGNRTEGILKAPQTAKVTFDQPFDFEKANEELLTAIKELKIGEVKEGEETQDSGSPAAMLNHVEAEEQENKEPGTFYKKDNFFDSISCEALERGKGPANRVDWKAERKLNAETFGLTGNGGQRRGGYYYRGGGGGGGGNNYGRGYYRGGYGYGGNRGGYQSRGGYGGGYSSYNNRYNGGGGGRGRDRDGNGQGSF